MITIMTCPKMGDKGSDVTVLQRVLKEKGYDVGTIDGVFGIRTFGQVQKFQSENSINASGLIGPKTLAALGLIVDTPIATTKPLSGRHARHLHPDLRIKIESKLYSLDELKMKRTDEQVIAVATALDALAIREVGGNNMGHDVGIIQSIIGQVSEQGTGDAWCMSTVQCIVAFIEDLNQIASPILASESCLEVWHDAEAKGLGLSRPEIGSFFIAEHGNSGLGHTGTIVGLNGSQMHTFEGNTGNGSLRDGDGAYMRTRLTTMLGNNFPVRGFVKIYPKAERV